MGIEQYVYGSMKSGAAFIFGSANVQQSGGGLQKFVYGAQKIGSSFVYASNTIPVIARQAANIIDIVTFGQFGVANALAGLIGSTPVKWGVFDTNGESIALADSVLRVSYSNGSRVSNYPVEEGSFATYNKVADPFTLQVVLACGGSESVRSDFINALDAAENSIDIYNVLLPETSYFNLNLERVDWDRTQSQGAGMVVATLYLVEVRETVTAAYSSPTAPDAQDPAQQGQLQLAPPDVSESSITKIGAFV